MYQDAFLFDYFEYKNKAQEIKKYLDINEVSPLYEEYINIYSDINPGEWILEGVGTILEKSDISEVNRDIDIGYYLLVILSKYLKPINSLKRDWYLLSNALKEYFNWNEDDARLLVSGLSTALFFDPNAERVDKFVLNNATYSHWVIPTQSNMRGWLSLEEISFFLDRLSPIKASLLALNLEQVDKLSEPRSEKVLTDNVERLQRAYQTEMEMLKGAFDKKLGLYLVIS